MSLLLHFNDLEWLKVKARRLYFVRCLMFATLSLNFLKATYQNFEFKKNTSMYRMKTPNVDNDYLLLPLPHGIFQAVF